MAFARSTILRTYNSLKGIGNLPEAKSMKDVKEIKSFVARWRNGTGDANPMDEMIPVKNQMYDTSSPLKFAVTFGIFCGTGLGMPFYICKVKMERARAAG